MDGRGGDDLRARLGALRRREEEFKQQLARAAIGLVNWTMLLWTTPWTDGICSCHLRFIKSATITATATFTPATACSKTTHNHLPNKALLMGVALSELALRQPIIVNLDVAGRTATFSRNGDIVDEMKLLQDLRMGPGPGYRSAVSHCFEYSRQLARGSGEGFRPSDIIVFKENIIKQYVNGCKSMSLITVLLTCLIA
jgi:hypothetical protein